jgi:hypothetical protein
MEKNLPQGYPLYDSVYGSEIPSEQYYVHLFDILPSRYSTQKDYNNSVSEFILSNGFEKESYVYNLGRRHDSSNQTLYINRDKKMVIRKHVHNGNDVKNKNESVRLEIVYSIKNGELETQFDFEELKKFEVKKKKSNINLVKSEMGHLDTEEYDLTVPPTDLGLNYGVDFEKIHEVIIERLNKPNDKGIILLHGDPGTGKTSYIKHLTSLINDKDILFIPPSMAEMLSEPSIIPFLMDHKNTILIIEDGERVISDREGNGSASGVSNILNLTDGILGDCLNIQIIVTFNMKRERIDKALLRKGRLIAEHKFENLTIEDTNKLLKSLGKNYQVEEGMCLADIYNIDVEEIRPSNKTKKIGFTN